MTYVVAEPCVKCKYTDCVSVCPVDCFHEGENALVIHPDHCIDCGACEPECPTAAIFTEDDLPDRWRSWLDLNAVLSGARPAHSVDMKGWPPHLVAAASSDLFVPWPVLTSKRTPLPDAAVEARREGKLAELSPRPGRGDP